MSRLKLVEPLQLNEGEKWVSVLTVDNNTKMVSVSADFVATNSQESNSLLAFVPRLNKFTTRDFLLDNLKIKTIRCLEFKILANKQILLLNRDSKINNFVNLVGE
tara:strand:- start:23 stop:337 length:315 start_codon:yes stop_codon:yes gene_type:complete